MGLLNGSTPLFAPRIIPETRRIRGRTSTVTSGRSFALLFASLPTSRPKLSRVPFRFTESAPAGTPGKYRAFRAFRWLIRIKSGASLPTPRRNKASNPPQFPAAAIPDDCAESRVRAGDFQELLSPEIGHFFSFPRQSDRRYCTRDSAPYLAFSRCVMKQVPIFSSPEIFQRAHFHWG